MLNLTLRKILISTTLEDIEVGILPDENHIYESVFKISADLMPEVNQLAANQKVEITSLENHETFYYIGLRFHCSLMWL